jgi:DNA-formamidopyrimidine glycosylase
MPEGHTIHRHARRHRQLLAGRTLRVSSPQDRFAAGAALLDGRRLEAVDAHGKHLFYRWEGGESLHVHLGLFGKFRTHRADPPPPTEGTRLAMAGDGVVVYLAGPTICEFIDPMAEDALRARLGPDPLANGREPGAFVEALSRRRIPIGAALLDQKVVAGIGNVYRAELLFLAGIDPARPANQLTAEEATGLWSLAVDELRAGVRSGRIVTVVPAEVGARRRSEIPRDRRLYVYKRTGEPCRRCRTPVAIREMAARSIWSCPRCQPA